MYFNCLHARMDIASNIWSGCSMYLGCCQIGKQMSKQKEKNRKKGKQTLQLTRIRYFITEREGDKFGHVICCGINAPWWYVIFFLFSFCYFCNFILKLPAGDSHPKSNTDAGAFWYVYPIALFFKNCCFRISKQKYIFQKKCKPFRPSQHLNCSFPKVKIFLVAPNQPSSYPKSLPVYLWDTITFYHYKKIPQHAQEQQIQDWSI